MRDPGLGSKGPLGRLTSAYLAKGGTRGSPRLWSPTPFPIPTTPAHGPFPGPEGAPALPLHPHLSQASSLERRGEILRSTNHRGEL